MRRRRILVVDDEPLLRRALARILVLAGWEVLEAHTPAEAEDVLAAHADVAAVLCDEGLEADSGLAWLERLAVRRPAVRRVLLSGAGTVPDPRGVLHGRVDKPWETSALLALLERLVGGRKTQG